MKDWFSYTDQEISLAIIGTFLIVGIAMCLGLCGLLHGLRRFRRRNSSGSSHNSNGIIKGQSQSMIRGEHPIAFVLPTVSMSEPASEISDLESLNTSYSTSPSLSMTGASSSGGGSVRPKIQKYQQMSGSLLRQSVLGASASASGSSPSRKRRFSRRRKRRLYSPLDSDCDVNESDIEGRNFTGQNSSSSPAKTVDLSTGDIALQIEDSPTEHPKGLQVFSPRPPALPENERSQVSFGFMKIAFEKDQKSDEFCISEIQISDLPPDTISKLDLFVKLRIFPESKRFHTTPVITNFRREGKLIHDERIPLPISENLLNEPQVLKLTLCSKSKVMEDNEAQAQVVKTLGHVLVNLNWVIEQRKSIFDFSRAILSDVEEELDEYFSDTLDISLTYDPYEGKLTLGILEGKIQSIPLQESECILYAKVTLFEGHRVVKAKKTHSVGLCRKPQFQETFSILFPPSHLDKVSCVISLCGKDRLGNKFICGRTMVGSSDFIRNKWAQKSDHWERMARNEGATVIQTHYLN